MASVVMRKSILSCIMLALSWPASAEIVAARYETPTTRYDHGILGDAVEWADLVMVTADGGQYRLSLPETRVFEDTEPRLVTLPGEPAVVAVVESDLALGARLALYRETGLVASTPFIGRTHRWLAPVGAADLDGDGRIEFAYVDRPHLARILRIWRYAEGDLAEVGSLTGFTNHRIGEDTIAGGIRDCGEGPELVLADAAWSNVMGVMWDGSGFSARVLARHRDRDDFARALGCR